LLPVLWPELLELAALESPSLNLQLAVLELPILELILIPAAKLLRITTLSLVLNVLPALSTLQELLNLFLRVVVSRGAVSLPILIVVFVVVSLFIHVSVIVVAIVIAILVSEANPLRRGKPRVRRQKNNCRKRQHHTQPKGFAHGRSPFWVEKSWQTADQVHAT
jgi:hypothetical protein